MIVEVAILDIREGPSGGVEAADRAPLDQRTPCGELLLRG